MRTPAKRAGMPQDLMNVTKGSESSPPNFHKIPKRNICRCLEGAPVHISQQYWTLGLCIVQADRFSGALVQLAQYLKAQLEGPESARISTMELPLWTEHALPTSLVVAGFHCLIPIVQVAARFLEIPRGSD